MIGVGEYYRAGWTFHAKGIWLFASSTTTATTLQPHLIGDTTAPISAKPIENTTTVISTTEPSPPNLAVTYIGHDSPVGLKLNSSLSNDLHYNSMLYPQEAVISARDHGIVILN